MENKDTKFNKKAWLDYLYYKIGKQQYDFYVCGLKKLSDGSVKATKWKKYSEVCFPLNPWEDYKIAWVNQRQILPNELVLDIEEPEKLPQVLNELLKTRAPFSVWETGSRGYHIHIFFKEEILPEERLFFIKKVGVDEQKSYSKVMIALENYPHWKTGRPKKQIANIELEADLKKFLAKIKYGEKKEVKDVGKGMKLEDYYGSQ